MKDKFIFREKGKNIEVCRSDIVFFESCGHYIIIYMRNCETHKIRCTMTRLSEMLNKNTFVRIHRGFIVNKHYVEKINYKGIMLKSSYDILPVSRSLRANAEAAFNSY